MEYTVSEKVNATVDRIIGLSSVKRAFEYIEADDTRSIEETVELAMIEAPTHHEEKKCKRIIEKFRSYGVTDARVGNGGNCIAIRPGTGKTGKYILIDGHMDTVFPFGTVKEPVYKDGAIYLPGISDDTRAIATELAVLRALNESGIQTCHDLLFSCTVCEEGMGSMQGMKDLMDEIGPESIAAAICIDGDDGGSIVYGATGIKTERITFRGPAGHAYVDFGTANCLHAAARAVSEISDLKVPEDPKTTYCVSNFHAGTESSAHAIVPECWIMINYRSKDPEILGKLGESIHRIIQESCDAENERAGTPGAVSWSSETVCDVPAGKQDPHLPVIEAASKCISTMQMTPTFEDGGCCNSNIAIGNGIPAITIGSMYRAPGFTEPTLFHTTEEHFYTEKSYLTVQTALLMILANAGISGETEPLSR